MSPASLIVWLCPLVGFACDSTPDLSVLQAAYERETSTGSSLHEKGLKLLKTKCRDDAGQQFLCEVTFTSTADLSERLYFNVVTVARTNGGWELKSELCTHGR